MNKFKSVLFVLTVISIIVTIVISSAVAFVKDSVINNIIIIFFI